MDIKYVGYAIVGVLAIMGALAIFDVTPASVFDSGGENESLPAADAPPLDFAYLDAGRAGAYLGQALNGLPTSEQRTEQLTHSVNVSLGQGAAAQLGGSAQTQRSTVATFVPEALDRFYTFLRLLRKGGEASTHKAGTCRNARLANQERPFWLGEVNDQAPAADILREVRCLGVGNFVRIRNAQLFLPPFAEALPRARSASTFSGALPAPRDPFTSPTQSEKLRGALTEYTKEVGLNARIPVVAAPFGSSTGVGSGVTFFLPTRYQGLATEPSLLSGSVTIVGKIVYLGGGKRPYVDNPTISTFGRAVLGAKPILLHDLGVCSLAPLAPTRSQRAAHTPHRRTCISNQEALDDIRESVTFKPPVVVVLPLAIYE